MLRYFSSLAMLTLVSLSLFGQEEALRNYYGLPYSWAEESGFSIEQTGDDLFTLIGTRQNVESLSTDIAFWTIGPTGGFIDSTVWALPNTQQILETFGGPDGGFLVVYRSAYRTEQDTVNLAYFNPDGTLSWNQPLVDYDNLRDGIRGLDFVNPTEVVLVYAVNGEFPETAPRVARVTANEGLVPLFSYLNNGFSEIWSLERQPDGNLLMTGGRGDEVFVTLVTPSGNILWENSFTNSIDDPAGRGYEFLSSAHRPQGDSVILVTGKRNLRRAFITMDTLGNRLEEHLVNNLSDFDEKERATWYGKNTVFINNSVDQYYQLIELEDYIPTGLFREKNRFVEDAQLFGSYYSQSKDVVLSALYDEGNQAFSRFDNSDLSTNIFTGGKPYYNADEDARGIVVLPEGKILLQTINSDLENRRGTSFWTTDSLGNLLNERMVVDARATVVPTIDGNFLFHHRTFTEVVVIKVDSEGNELWRANPETNLTEFRANVLVDLGQGEFAWSESYTAIGDNGTFERTRITHSDSTGATLNTFFTEQTGEIFSMTTDLTGNLIVAGSSYTGTGGLILSYDLTTGTENWRTFYQKPTFNYCIDTKLQSLPDGTIGVFSKIGRRGNSRESQLDFRKIDPNDGTEIGQLVLEDGRFFSYAHQLAQRDDGLITMVFGYNSIGDGEPQLLRVKEVDPVSMRLVNTFEFSNFSASVEPAGIAFIDTTRTAIIATTYVPNMGLSTDVLLIIFNTQGYITNIRGQQPLPINITISPNPTPDVLRVTTSGATSAGSLFVQLFDVAGRQLIQKKIGAINQVEVDLSAFTAGTYFLLVRDEKGRSISRKVVKL